jgi:uncharacterized protein (TIGR00290 family)
MKEELMKVLVSWSGGKDSAFTLHEVLKGGKYEVAALLTTITEEFRRVSIHGVREDLLERQALSLGLPLEKVFISSNSSNEEYESRMKEVLLKHQGDGVSGVVFGDIFLEDLREHRESNLSKIGLKGIFPIWRRSTDALSRSFVDLGFKAVVTCIDSDVMDKKFVGRKYDRDFLNEMPTDIDLCGEKGEFHSFVYDGPIFKEQVVYKRGEIVLKNDRFYFCDLVPDEEACSQDNKAVSAAEV